MIRIIVYCIAEIIFFPTIILLFLSLGLTLADYDIFLGFEKFFATPLSWITLAASTHLGITLGNKITQKRLSVSDNRKLKNLQKVVPIIYIFFMVIALLKLSSL